MINVQHVHDLFKCCVDDKNPSGQDDQGVHIECGREQTAVFIERPVLQVVIKRVVVCGMRDMFGRFVQSQAKRKEGILHVIDRQQQYDQQNQSQKYGQSHAPFPNGALFGLFHTFGFERNIKQIVETKHSLQHDEHRQREDALNGKEPKNRRIHCEESL